MNKPSAGTQLKTLPVFQFRSPIQPQFSSPLCHEQIVPGSKWVSLQVRTKEKEPRLWPMRFTVKWGKGA